MYVCQYIISINIIHLYQYKKLVYYYLCVEGLKNYHFKLIFNLYRLECNAEWHENKNTN